MKADCERQIEPASVCQGVRDGWVDGLLNKQIGEQRWSGGEGGVPRFRPRCFLSFLPRLSSVVCWRRISFLFSRGDLRYAAAYSTPRDSKGRASVD